MIVSNDPADTLITYSLGSCLGVVLWDEKARIGGLIHCMLPQSRVDSEKAIKTPAMFVDTGIPLLFKKMAELGSHKKNIIIKAAGCSQIMDPEGHFQIGERNFTILRKLLWKNDLLIHSKSIGGNISRTISLDVGTGKTLIRTGKIEKEL